MSSGPDNQNQDTQRVVWSHVNDRIREQGCASSTESYADLIKYRMEKTGIDFPVCEPEKGCNGLAVILGRKVISADLFGREEVYRYYFPMLRDSAFRIATQGKKCKPVDQHEAYFKVLDAIDSFEAADKHHDSNYSGAGFYKIFETTIIVGSELTVEGQLIHSAIFTKQD